MTYNELLEYARKNISFPTIEHFPRDSFSIAYNLGLAIKNSIECKQEFSDKENPLNYSEGCLAITKGQYTIYHNEKYAYRNFIVAHEVAHYLLKHENDGADQHHDANLLAAIIVVPPEIIKKKKIKSAEELSNMFLIPCDVAMEYWSNIKNISKPPKKRIKYRDAIDIALIVALFTTLCFMGFTNKSEDNHSDIATQHNITAAPDVTYTPVPTFSPAPQIEATNTTTVYVTSSGKKYHITGCRYIKNKTNITPLTQGEAVSRNLQPCSICIGQ